MPVLWVKAAICGQETTIEVRKISQTKVSILEKKVEIAKHLRR
jgi:hypothetical protein